MPVLELSNSLLDQEALGSGPKFPLAIDPATNEFALAKYEENVKESVFWLVSVRLGERVMNEDMGSLFEASLFEDPEQAAEVLPFQTVELLRRYEPRITEVRCRADRISATELRLVITWVIKSSGRRGSLEYDYNLNGGG
jgi:phage baseplate assembly protein W